MSKSRMFTLKDDTKLLLLYRFFYSTGLVSQIYAGNHHNHYPFPGAAEGSRKCNLKILQGSQLNVDQIFTSENLDIKVN